MKTAVIRSRDFSTNINERFDASFHLSEGIAVKRLIHKSPYPLTTVGKGSKDIFYGNRAKRTYVSDKKYGIPFLSSSDILKADVESVKLASKKYTPCIEQLRLQEGWILVSRSGTIGNTAWTNKQHAQKLASEDVIRIIPNDILRGGYIYAYLSTKYGHSLLTQGAFGAVIQHIEPDHIASIPIPCLPDTFQTQIDGLIKESAHLREEAAIELRTAHEILERSIPLPLFKSKNNVSFQSIVTSYTHRFEGQYYTSANRSIYDFLTQGEDWKTLRDYSDKIFRPGIFKRDYVKQGIPFLGGADIMLATPKSDKQLSIKQVQSIPELKVSEGWILVTCGGTIGNSVYVDRQLSKCVVSQHVIRIVPKSNVKTGFLFAFLSSHIGSKLITLYSFGSVIPQVEPHHLERIPIPDIDTNIVNQIDDLVKSYAKKCSEAKEKELKAISLVEAEIEKWTKQ